MGFFFTQLQLSGVLSHSNIILRTTLHIPQLQILKDKWKNQTLKIWGLTHGNNRLTLR